MRILDPLYGRVELPDFVRDILYTPELQRLSEIRLMNVPGSTMLGATTTTRLEHALGVAHLANVYSTANRFCDIERNNLILGSLIHDVASFPYGHLVENIFRRFFPGSADHSHRLLVNIFNQKEDLPIYRGAVCQLYRKLYKSLALFGRAPILSACLVLGPTAIENSPDVLYKDMLPTRTVSALHRLISGPMDLDNIDNVFRVACRFGLGCKPDLAEKLAASFMLSGTSIRMEEGNLWLLEEWQRTRAAVYEIFLTDPDILAMKALLTHCVEYALAKGTLHEGDWVLTDVQLLEALLGSADIKHEMRQILLGHELKCYFLVDCPGENAQSVVAQLAALREELALSLSIEDTRKRKTDTVSAIEHDCGARRLYVTAEIDKGATTRRCEVEVLTGDGGSAIRPLGTDSNRLILSLQLPRWCRLRSPQAGHIVVSAIARRLGCAEQDITQLVTSDGWRAAAAFNGELFE